MRLFKFSIVLFLFLALSSPAAAAELSGQILYANGRPASGITVTVNSGMTSVTTDGSGRYSIQLEPGNYTLNIGNESFPVHVFPGRTQRNFQLRR